MEEEEDNDDDEADDDEDATSVEAMAFVGAERARLELELVEAGAREGRGSRFV